jgi:hypothetical protein
MMTATGRRHLVRAPLGVDLPKADSQHDGQGLAPTRSVFAEQDEQKRGERNECPDQARDCPFCGTGHFTSGVAAQLAKPLRLVVGCRASTIAGGLFGRLGRLRHKLGQQLCRLVRVPLRLVETERCLLGKLPAQDATCSREPAVVQKALKIDVRWFHSVSLQTANGLLRSICPTPSPTVLGPHPHGLS